MLSVIHVLGSMLMMFSITYALPIATSVIYADGLLYCYAEDGALGLVKASPERCEVVSSFKVPLGDGPHWTHPVVADGRLYVRHGDVLMCYDIAGGE